jgi:hypothetical protein
MKRTKGVRHYAVKHRGIIMQPFYEKASIAKTVCLMHKIAHKLKRNNWTVVPVLITELKPSKRMNK